MGNSKALRWRRLTHPQPLEFNLALAEGHEQLVQHIDRLHGTVAFGPALDALASASASMLAGDSPVGELMSRSVDEAGAGDCAVVGWKTLYFDDVKTRTGRRTIDISASTLDALRGRRETLLLKAAVPVKVVPNAFGHASPGFTLNVYQHALPGMQAEAALVFERLLDGPNKGLSVAARPPTACIDLSHELTRRLETVAQARGSSVERLVEELLGGVA